MFLSSLMTITVAAMLWGRYAGLRQFWYPLTALAAALYLAAALSSGALRSPYGRGVLLALGCCALGDLTGPGNFIAGVCFFLIAHLFMAGACVWRGLRWRRMALCLPVLLLADGVVLYRVLDSVPGKELPLIVAYVTVISVMLLAAAGASTNNGWLLAGAIVFYLSDYFVARWRYGGGSINGYFCYPLYYAACMMFAFSAYRATLQSPAEPPLDQPSPE